MQPTASPAPDVSISQDLRHAASVLSKFYEELPVILTRLLTAGAAIIIGLLLLRLFRRLLNKHLRYRPGTTRRTMQQVETLRSLIGSVMSYLMYFFIALVCCASSGWIWPRSWPWPASAALPWALARNRW